MNDQPPSSPVPPPPAPVPPTQVILRPQGMGCFAKGCLTFLVLGFIFIAGVMACVWFVVDQTMNNLTSAGSAAVQLEQPTEPQFQAAETTLTRLNKAIANKEETTVEFTSADLNALLARDEDFKEFRGRARIDIADSMMTIALSVPLDSIHWRRMRRRWFNGTARFGFSYSSGEFRVDLDYAEAGGHRLSGRFIPDIFMSSLDDSLSESFQEKLRDFDSGEDFAEQVTSMSLVGDKLVVTTKAK